MLIIDVNGVGLVVYVSVFKLMGEEYYVFGNNNNTVLMIPFISMDSGVPE